MKRIMATENKSLSRKKRYQPIPLPQDFSDEEMARDWTLTENDLQEISKYRKISRLFISVQICSVRLYGRFINEVDVLSPRVVNYLNGQMGLSPSLTFKLPDREATLIEYRKKILSHLGFRKFDIDAQADLQEWLVRNNGQGIRYILRYITAPALRRTVQLQLNKGEYRHKLPRWIFFANQGEFSTGDGVEVQRGRGAEAQRDRGPKIFLVKNGVVGFEMRRDLKCDG